MSNISRTWYKEVFEKHVKDKYGSLYVLKEADTIRDGKISEYMSKQAIGAYCTEDPKEIMRIMNESKKLCSSLINRYRV